MCDTLNADEIDSLTRAITAKVYQKEGVLLTAISVYSYNTKDPEVTQMRDKLVSILKENPNVLQVHGFYVEKEKKAMRFDMVVSFNEKDRGKLYQDTREALSGYAEKGQRSLPGLSGDSRDGYRLLRRITGAALRPKLFGARPVFYDGDVRCHHLRLPSGRVRCTR